MEIEEYKNKMSYPARPKKPMLPANHTQLDVKNYAVQLEKWEKEDEAYNAAKKAYYTEEGRLTDLFRKDLAEEVGIAGNPKEEKVWAMAWENGHSEGLSGVKYWYEELAELVK